MCELLQQHKAFRVGIQCTIALMLSAGPGYFIGTRWWTGNMKLATAIVVECSIHKASKQRTSKEKIE